MVDKKETLLHISNLTVHYGAAQALFGVDSAVGQGETVSPVGARRKIACGPSQLGNI